MNDATRLLKDLKSGKVTIDQLRERKAALRRRVKINPFNVHKTMLANEVKERIAVINQAIKKFQTMETK